MEVWETFINTRFAKWGAGGRPTKETNKLLDFSEDGPAGGEAVDEQTRLTCLGYPV